MNKSITDTDSVSRTEQEFSLTMTMLLVAEL